MEKCLKKALYKESVDQYKNSKIISKKPKIQEAYEKAPCKFIIEVSKDVKSYISGFL